MRLTFTKKYRSAPARLPLLVAALCVCAPGAVWAGFEFVPPPAIQAVPMHNMNDAMQNVPAMAALPASKVEAAPLMPGFSGHDASSMMPMPLSAAPVMSAPSSMPESGGEFAVVEGFGRDMPLALVMQQLVPERFAYSFDPGIDPGLRVNWDGGRAWDNVLDDALMAHGLQARVQNDTVRVMKMGGQPGAAPDAPMPLLAAPDMVQTMRVANIEPPPAPVSAQEQMPAAQTQDTQAQAGRIVPEISESPEKPPSILFTRGDGLGAVWQAARGDSLHDTLHRWAAQAGVVLYWNASDDFRLPGAVDSQGGFTQAVEDILRLYASYDDRPVGRLYNQPGGAPVLVVDYYAGATATN